MKPFHEWTQELAQAQQPKPDPLDPDASPCKFCDGSGIIEHHTGARCPECNA